MRKAAMLVATLVAVAGCVTGERMASVSPGMTKDDVIGLMGKPDGFDSDGDHETLTYTNRLMSGWSWDRGDYIIELQNGKVVRYGVGAVRQNPQPIAR
jgi:outer membrane protein assembly factor BamE (lipoprotein component of BamABCDE complex)